MDYGLLDLSPKTLWEAFAQFVDTKKAGVFEGVASFDNSANELGLGGDLHASALGIMESLMDIILVLGRHHWGEPHHLFERKPRDTAWPACDGPGWLEEYLYPQGIPTLLYRVVGWNRTRKRGGSVIGFAYIDLYSDDGDETKRWQITLTFGVLPSNQALRQGGGA